MKILGIETSCDEIAAAVVENGNTILSDEIASSVELHKKTGGVVPEIAARDAAEKIQPVIKKAVKNAKCNWKDIDAIAVTNGPGLVGSLFVGMEAARTLSFIHQKPIIPVHHIVGHIFSNLLNTKHKPIFPSLVLTVSGGHNDLVIWQDYLKFKLVGETRDDAAGEAFDKVAKMLGLPFPGGPAISRLAEQGNRNAYKFPRPMSKSDNFDFSFSGLKTAVFYEVKNLTKENKKLTKKQVSDIAASFEEAVIDSLANKLFAVAKKYKTHGIYLAGGVSANTRLKEKIQDFCKKTNIDFFYPSKISHCTDNAAMIASAAYFMFKKFPNKKWKFEDVKLNLNYNLPNI